MTTGIDNVARAVALKALDTATSSTMTMTTNVITASTSSVTLATSKIRRGQGVTIKNNGYGDLFVRLGSTAVTTENYTEVIEPGVTATITSDHIGSIQGIWSVVGGSASVTEFT